MAVDEHGRGAGQAVDVVHVQQRGVGIRLAEDLHDGHAGDVVGHLGMHGLVDVLAAAVGDEPADEGGQAVLARRVVGHRDLATFGDQRELVLHLAVAARELFGGGLGAGHAMGIDDVAQQHRRGGPGQDADFIVAQGPAGEVNGEDGLAGPGATGDELGEVGDGGGLGRVDESAVEQGVDVDHGVGSFVSFLPEAVWS